MDTLAPFREAATRLLLLFLCAFSLVAALPKTAEAGDGTWAVLQAGSVLEIAYCTSGRCPQYGALHLASSYFRLVPSASSGWGTSVVLCPAFWSGGTYYQGCPITATWRDDGEDLVLLLEGTIGPAGNPLLIFSEVRLSPPAGDIITAQVAIVANGSTPLDARPGEIFKPMMLSSMHISPRQWDAQAAYVGSRTFLVPTQDWIIQPPLLGTVFGLQGGSSDWKADAPTVEVVLDRPLHITGWLTPSLDTNDDNLALWAGSDQLLSSWQYRIIAARPTIPVPLWSASYLPLLARSRRA